MIDEELYQRSGEEQVTGMGVYNAGNIEFEGIVQGARALTEEELKNEYETGEIHFEKQTQEYKEADKAFKAMLLRDQQFKHLDGQQQQQ